MQVICLLLLSFAFASSPALATQSAKPPSAAKLIDRYKKAAGGNALKRVKSTLLAGSIHFNDTAAGRFTVQTAGPDRLRVDIDAEGWKSSEAYNGKSAWRMDARGLRTLLGDEAKRLRLEALLANTRLNDLGRHRIFAQPPIKAVVDGRDAWAVEFIRDEARVKLFFDAATGLISKRERETAEGLEEVFYADYQPVAGVMEPRAIRLKRGESEWRVLLDRAEHNRSVDEVAFRYPQTEGRPLPEVESLMRAVVANQERIEELREQYTFRESETEREVEKGQVKKSETKVYDVTPVAGRFVRRLVSVNGRELSPQEREREDRRVQKEVEELLKRQAKEKERETRRREKPEEEPYEDRSITILSFLKTSAITSVRRERFRGHEVIAFDFEPRKDFKPKNRLESLVSKLAGTMWVDEQSRQIVRLEARLTDSFKVGGGLVGSVSPQTAVALEQEKVNGEVWLPSAAEANISARILLFAKLSRNVVTTYSDYRKVQIDSEYELSKPKQP